MRQKFATSIEKKLLEKVREKAYLERKNQNDVIEAALRLYFERDGILKGLKEVYKKERDEHGKTISKLFDKYNKYDMPVNTLEESAKIVMYVLDNETIDNDNRKDIQDIQVAYDNYLKIAAKVELLDMLKGNA